MYQVRPSYLLKKVYSDVVWRKDATEKKIYLTFDDGPVPEVTPLVLDILKSYSIRATFFCVGENVVKHQDVYQRILLEGHSVGNHTYNHLNGWNTRLSVYLENTEKCAVFVRSGLFRPPYGRIRKKQKKELLKNYSIVMWDVLSGDYDKHTAPEKCLRNVVEHVRNGSIVLFHDSIKAKENVLYTLPRFIENAGEQGFQFGVL